MIKSLLTANAKFWQMRKAQKLDPSIIRAIQDRKLRYLFSQSSRHVPYYQEFFQQAGVSPDDIVGIDDLHKIPITSKTAMRATEPSSLLDDRVDRNSLLVERSSGSTGTPFNVYYDKSFQTIRNLMFLRGLYAVGYRFGHKLLLITSRKPQKLSHRFLQWHYVSIEDSREILWREFCKTSPQFLYGCVSSLRLLAEMVLEMGGGPRPRGVITTAETLEENARAFLNSAFGCDVFDFYGMSEMGLVGWECPEHRGYHLSEDTVLIEAIPVEGKEDIHRLVMTNLESKAMPFLRYDTGDLAKIDNNDACECGCRFSLMKRIEGREVDCVLMQDGRKISPYKLTCELEKISNIERYQVVQESYKSLKVRVQKKIGQGDCSDEQIRRAVEAAIGGEMLVDIESVDKLLPAPGQKFRVVECKL